MFYTLLIRASKFGSDLSDRFEINFFRHVGHSLLLKNEELLWLNAFVEGYHEWYVLPPRRQAITHQTLLHMKSTKVQTLGANIHMAGLAS